MANFQQKMPENQNYNQTSSIDAETNNSDSSQRQIFNQIILPKINQLNNSVLQQAANIVTENDLKNARHEYVCSSSNSDISYHNWWPHRRSSIYVGLLFVIVGIFCGLPWAQHVIASVMGIRCFVPNNYMIWEATRPITDCDYCRAVSRPVILSNATKEEFLVIVVLPFSLYT